MTLVSFASRDAPCLNVGRAGGFWLRRRRIDGALNRVPPEFYARVWGVLDRTPAGVSLANHLLSHELTKEVLPRAPLSE